MANTTNFGWETPDDTDLVKDGALAMRTLGNAIDASLVDLKGGTSGQILAKNSNTDMDFVWVANDQGDITAVTAGTGLSGGGTSGAVTLTNTVATTFDAKGDLVAGTGADTFAKLVVGTNNSVLSALSTETTGLVWTGLETSFTPTLTNITIGNGTNEGYYSRVGDIVYFQGKITLGSTTSITGHPQISLPITAAYSSGITGSVEYADVGIQGFFGFTFLNSATTANFWTINTAGTYPTWASVSATVPFTFGNGDFLYYRMTYLAA